MSITTDQQSWISQNPSYINVTSGYGAASTNLGPGNVSYPGSSILSIGAGWATWCCGYTGEVVWNGGTSVTLTFSGLSAFGMQIEPNIWTSEPMTVTLSNGQTVSEVVGGYAGADFIGFTGDNITYMTINDLSGDSFALGNFYALPVAPTVKVTGADLVANNVTVKLSGSSGISGVLTVSAQGSNGSYAATTPANAIGPGEYTLHFDRVNMPTDAYTSISAK